MKDAVAATPGVASVSGPIVSERGETAIVSIVPTTSPKDEATSDLDAESEFIVQQALADLTRGRTVFLIAHRLSTVRLAHRIAVFHEGRVAEEGAHETLLARDGLYRRLHSLQFAPAGPAE